METSRLLYEKLLGLYPRAFRERFGEPMAQTFSDLYTEQKDRQGGLFGFVLWMFFETTLGIAREYVLVLQGETMKTMISNPKLAALIGFCSALPFMMLNAIVGGRIEPFISMIRPTTHTSSLEYMLLAFVLLLLPLGAFVAVRPSLQKGADGTRKLYIANAILAVVLVAGFVVIAGALGEELYRCDVLLIPNCD